MRLVPSLKCLYLSRPKKEEDKKDKEILIERMKMLTKQQKKNLSNLRQCQGEKKKNIKLTVYDDVSKHLVWLKLNKYLTSDNIEC